MGHLSRVIHYPRPIQWLIVALVVGCTSPGAPPREVQPAAPVQPLPARALDETVLDAQAQWLTSFVPGQLLADTTVPTAVEQAGSVTTPTSGTYYYSVEASQNGKLYQYIQGLYPNTRLPYGLYFQDGRLTGLILGKDVVNFYHCEQFYRHGGYQPAYRRNTPLPYRIETVSQWIGQHNRLGTDDDARRVHVELDAHGRARNTNHVQRRNPAGAVEVIAHVPIAMMAAPIYGVSRLSPFRGMFQKLERERVAKRQRWADTARDIHPGSLTGDALLELMGPPVSKFSWPGGEGLSYSWPDDPDQLSFGIKDGLVAWKVAGARDTPAGGSARPTQDDCGAMRVTIN
ncbi:MAG: hypothetical protein HUJ31_18715 [Pseudomonadales bacterium]|nr:hypothetical protein [Pseudomonadales bacterium]